MDCPESSLNSDRESEATRCLTEAQDGFSDGLKKRCSINFISDILSKT
jgi:hypothetical protein